MPRKCSVYSSSDEETYNSSWQHYSISCSHRKTRSPSSSRHRNITSRHSPSHSDTRWERHRSLSLSWTRRKRHWSQSCSRSNPRKMWRHSRSHSRDFHTNKEHYRSRSCSKSRGSRSVLTSPHNASGRKGETSSTTERLKYHSRSSSRYRKETSNWRNNRSRSHSQTWSKRNESRSLSHSKERKRRRQRSCSNDSKDIHTHKVKEHYRSRSRSTDSRDIHTNKRALQIANTLTFKSQRQSQSHVLRILFIRYCADKTLPKITIPIANTFMEKLLQTFRHFPTKTMWDVTILIAIPFTSEKNSQMYRHLPKQRIWDITIPIAIPFLAEKNWQT